MGLNFFLVFRNFGQNSPENSIDNWIFCTQNIHTAFSRFWWFSLVLYTMLRVVMCRVSIGHCPKNNLILRIKTEPATFGARCNSICLVFKPHKCVKKPNLFRCIRSSRDRFQSWQVPVVTGSSRDRFGFYRRRFSLFMVQWNNGKIYIVTPV